MLKMETLTLGDYQTNCYIVYDDGGDKCVIIDPGYEPETIRAALTRLALTPEAIFLTHGHFDHVGGVKALARETGCEVWLCEGDYSQPPVFKMLYPLAGCAEPEIHFYEEGEELTRGGLHWSVLATPGHTGGSVCLMAENVLFSGDTLFSGSCGRTDLPGGSWKWIRWSLERLAELEGDYIVCPGHGERTRLSRERAVNPYMRKTEEPG